MCRLAVVKACSRRDQVMRSATCSGVASAVVSAQNLALRIWVGRERGLGGHRPTYGVADADGALGDPPAGQRCDGRAWMKVHGWPSRSSASYTV
jgi:hypothetical protein